MKFSGMKNINLFFFQCSLKFYSLYQSIYKFQSLTDFMYKAIQVMSIAENIIVICE